MKVFNLTDVETRTLKQQGLKNVPVKVGDTVIPPGEARELRGSARERAEASALVRRGAIAVDSLPPGYAHKRGLLLSGAKKPEPKSKEDPVKDEAVKPSEDPKPPRQRGGRRS